MFEQELTAKLNGILGIEGNTNMTTLQPEPSRYNKNTSLYKSLERNNTSIDVDPKQKGRMEHNISLP